MSLFLFFLSFIAGIGVIGTFIKGMIDYLAVRPYRKWWQISLGLFAATSVLTLTASLFDPELGLGAGFILLWIYISLLMAAFILVYIIKMMRKDSTKGYLRRIVITFVAGCAALFIASVSTEPIDTTGREADETIAATEETVEEAATEEEDLEKEREAIEEEKAALEAEREKLEEEKSVEQEKKDEQEHQEKEEAERKEKEKTASEEKSIEEKEETEAAEAAAEEQEEPEEEKVYEPGTKDRIPVTVASYTDGDTTRFIYNGENVPFRYLLIDTPETNHPRVGEQPFGQEASDRTKELLSNAETIEVEFDIGEKQDHYQRYLAYIYADGEMVNEILVREGLAQVNYVEPPNIRHLEKLEAAQALAREEQIGIWSLPHPFDSDVYQESGTDEGGSGSESSGPDDTSVESTEPVQGSESFQNCTELKKVYPDGVAEGHAAYQSKMDRDNDGWACE